MIREPLIIFKCGDNFPTIYDFETSTASIVTGTFKPTFYFFQDYQTVIVKLRPDSKKNKIIGILKVFSEKMLFKPHQGVIASHLVNSAMSKIQF
jgi:hypothetical protein